MGNRYGVLTVEPAVMDCNFCRCPTVKGVQEFTVFQKHRLFILPARHCIIYVCETVTAGKFIRGATTKITIHNRRLNRQDFEKSILIPMREDGLDLYRKEYNNMLLEKATGAESVPATA